MCTENSAIPCRDGCPIQVIPSIALFSGASSICALDSLGTEADASTLRSALNGEVF
jgi:hypothetical protein